MQIVYRPIGKKVEPLIKTVERVTPTLREGKVDIDRGAQVMSMIQNAEALALNPGTRDEGLRRLIELPVSYFIAGQFDKAAQAASYLFKRKLTTPQQLFERISEAVVKKASLIQRLETQRGTGKPGRITLGGLIDPGFRTQDILASGDNNRAFAASSVREGLEAATRRNKNGYLMAMFPHLEPVSENRSEEVAFKPHVVHLRHTGCCGLEMITPDGFSNRDN